MRYIDVRTKEEFDEDHIEGAVNIDIYSDNFKNEISKLDKNESYLIYCASGARSANATSFMREIGFGQVLDGGGIDDIRNMSL